MKKISRRFAPFFVFITLLLSSATLFAQEKVTWIGIDYSQTKFVGKAGFPDPASLPIYLQAWNDFVLTEPDKYDLKAALGYPNLTIDLKKTNAVNSALSPADQVQEDEFQLSKEEAEAVAQSYDLSDMDGVAVLMVAECYSKKRDRGSYWLVELEADSGRVLSSRRLEAKTGGFGLRNYWARTFYGVLEELGKEQKRK